MEYRVLLRFWDGRVLCFRGDLCVFDVWRSRVDLSG